MKNYTIARINVGDGCVATVEFSASSDDIKKALALVTRECPHGYTIAYTEGFYFPVSSRATLEELNDIANRVDKLEKLDGDKFVAMTEICESLEQVERYWNFSFFVPWWDDDYEKYLNILGIDRHRDGFHKVHGGIVSIPIKLR